MHATSSCEILTLDSHGEGVGTSPSTPFQNITQSLPLPPGGSLRKRQRFIFFPPVVNKQRYLVHSSQYKQTNKQKKAVRKKVNHGGPPRKVPSTRKGQQTVSIRTSRRPDLFRAIESHPSIRACIRNLKISDGNIPLEEPSPPSLPPAPPPSPRSRL